MEKVTDKSAEVDAVIEWWLENSDISDYKVLAYKSFEAGLEEAARAMCGGCKEGSPMTMNGDMELCHYKLHSNGYTRILSQCRAQAIRAIAQTEPQTVHLAGCGLTAKFSPAECPQCAYKLAAPAAAKIGEPDEPQLIATMVYNHEKQTITRIPATGASEAAVKDALLASEVPHCRDCGGVLDKYSEPVVNGFCRICAHERTEPGDFRCDRCNADAVFKGTDNDVIHVMCGGMFRARCCGKGFFGDKHDCEKSRPISPATEQGKCVCDISGPNYCKVHGGECVTQQPTAEGSAGQPHNLIHPAYISGCADCYEWQANRATTAYAQTGKCGEGPSCGHCGAAMVRTVLDNNKAGWNCMSCGATTGATPCAHAKKVYEAGNTFCADCHFWLESGNATGATQPTEEASEN